MLNEQLPEMSVGAREASALLVTELLKPLDRRQGGDGAKPARWSALQLRERVLDYIDVNLHDPKLTPSVIAAAHAVSVRALYSAVNGLGMTLGGYSGTDGSLAATTSCSSVPTRSAWWRGAGVSPAQRISAGSSRTVTACRRVGYASSTR